ncbi:hypothetical protein NB689_003182 [Xanthomonas sacchari]|nr:hypothetical protein [Xanthomonas sacchari]MCW0417428.1 hypothetical protein [Xanthomonas sacchari]
MMKKPPSAATMRIGVGEDANTLARPGTARASPPRPSRYSSTHITLAVK